MVVAAVVGDQDDTVDETRSAALANGDGGERLLAESGRVAHRGGAATSVAVAADDAATTMTAVGDDEGGVGDDEYVDWYIDGGCGDERRIVLRP